MDEELKKDTEAVLNLFTQPQLSSHDGGPGIIDPDQDSILWIEVQSGCAGCPSADETVRSPVQRELVTHIPQVRGVEINSGINDEVIEEAMRFFTHGTDSRINKNYRS